MKEGKEIEGGRMEEWNNVEKRGENKNDRAKRKKRRENRKVEQ